MISWLEVGMLVRLESAPEWGVGQVQAVDGSRVTVNFPNAGKRAIDASAAELIIEAEDPAGHLGNGDAD